jgi:hypothetical protein
MTSVLQNSGLIIIAARLNRGQTEHGQDRLNHQHRAEQRCQRPQTRRRVHLHSDAHIVVVAAATRDGSNQSLAMN